MKIRTRRFLFKRMRKLMNWKVFRKSILFIQSVIGVLVEDYCSNRELATHNENTETLRKQKKEKIRDDEIVYVKQIRKVQSIIDNIKYNCSIAVYGSDKDIEYFLKCIDLSALNIKFLATESLDKEINHILCKAPTKANLKEVDTLIIVDFYNRGDAEKAIAKLFSGEIVKIYDHNDTLPFYTKLWQNEYVNASESNEELFANLESTIGKIKSKSDMYISYRRFPKEYSVYKTVRGYNEFIDTAIVIQGPIVYKDNFTLNTIKHYLNIYPQSKIILSTWEDEESSSQFQGFLKLNIEIILNKKPTLINHPSLTTINFQLSSTFNGLIHARKLGCKYVLKIRSDSRINSLYFLSVCRDLSSKFKRVNEKQNSRLVIMPQKYGNYNNIKDYLMFGEIEDMLVYWEHPIDLDSKKYELSNPEITMSKRYFSNLGLKYNSQKKYDQIMRDYFITIDVDDFGFYWDKYGFGDTSFDYDYNSQHWLSHQK